MTGGRTPAYAPLCLQSCFSLLRGTVSIEAIVGQLAEYGIDSAALTDRNNLYGAVFFQAAAERAKIKPIVGAEVTGGDDDRAVLLARDRTGYGNVCRIVSRRMLDPDFDLAAAIAADCEGMFVLTGSSSLASALRPQLEPGALWMEIPIWAGPRLIMFRRETARKLGIGIVAGGAMTIGSAKDASFQQVLAAVRTRSVVGEIRSAELASPEGYLRPPDEAARLLRDVPEAIANSRAIADACRVDLLRQKPIFPRYPIPEGETPYAHLDQICREGLRRRYGPAITPETAARLQHELDVIYRSGFTEYFIVVGDLVHHARTRGIPVVGRGSGASSLVAYVLGITSVDPIAHRLYFERFLNSLRDDWPDLDVDLCWRGRDEVIDFAYDRYGRDRVAMISTHNHYHPRSAFRDAARAFGIPTEVVDRVSRRIPREIGGTIPSHFATSGLLGEYPREQEPYRTTLEVAERLRGMPRHLGIHCGGIVIGDRPLERLTGLEEATKGIVVTQYEMDSVEHVGLVKIDLLGNRAISTIRETVALVEELRGETIDIDDIPEHDDATAELLGTGRTLGCFQIESPGMRNLLRQIGTENMARTIDAHSLIRPGPASSGMKEKYIRRVRGLEPVEYGHAELRGLIGDLLDNTFGVPLYEEDVMCVAHRVVGISLEEGDLLRRRIGEARDEDSMRALTNSFLGLAGQRGVDPDVAVEVWRMIARFASYSFCKAHAAGYGVLAYQTAWLKAHYPEEHTVSLLNNHQGMYPTRVHLEEARRRGIPIGLPCVNRSGEEFTLDWGDRNGDEMRRGGGSPTAQRAMIRTGLAFVRDLSEAVRERIYRERPFRSLADFLRRVRPPRRDGEHLILVGGFDWTGVRRTELLWELYATYEEVRRGWERRGGAVLREAMFTDEEMFPPAQVAGRPRLGEIGIEERLRYEMRILGLAVSAHPVALIRPTEVCEGTADSRSLNNGSKCGDRIVLVGIRDAARLVRTKKDNVMMFLTLEDEHDLFECTLFPPVYGRFASEARGGGPFRVTGKIEEQYGVRTVTVKRIENLGRKESLLAEVLDEAETW